MTIEHLMPVQAVAAAAVPRSAAPVLGLTRKSYVGYYAGKCVGRKGLETKIADAEVTFMGILPPELLQRVKAGVAVSDESEPWFKNAIWPKQFSQASELGETNMDKRTHCMDRLAGAGRAAAASLLALATLVPLAAPAAAQSAASGLSPAVFTQIQAIVSDKSKWTAAQKKLDPGLLYAARAARGEEKVPGSGGAPMPPTQADRVITNGFALVDISTSEAAVVAQQIRAAGGTVVSSFPQFQSVRASVPLTALESIAGIVSVKSIRPAEEPETNRILPPPGFDKRSEAVRSQLSRALRDGVQANVGTGATISEAVVAHGANLVQNAGTTGSGQKVCVISNGISTLATRQGAGELPSVQILATGQASSSGDEGTAMLELVADMAPGASLGWSTGNGGKAQMAQNILDLRNVMGCTIIVDDLTYFSEGAFQEDVIANAVTTVVNSGAMYFSSSANSGHLSGGQSGTWEGDFLNGGAVSGPIQGTGETGFFHNFGTVGSPVLFNTLSTATSTGVSLKWSDPLAGAGNDYDLFVTNAAGTTLTNYAALTQSGTQDPFEFISASIPAGSRIYVVLFSGSARALRVDTNRGRLSIGTNGSTYGHNSGVNTTAVGAISSNFLPTSGRKFNSSDTTTTYSSDGPRKLFLNPTPATTYITPGCALYSCGGGTLLPKVDIAAADCNTTTTPGFIPFCGTSAAAPQAAAIAALVKSSAPNLTGRQVIARMKATAIDNMAPGRDVDSGAGIVMADAAVNTRIKFPHDFNGDASGDILWRDTSNGNTIVSLMAGNAITTSTLVANLPLTWSIVGSGDFNGDGRSDILWRDTSGNTVVSTMNASGVISASTFIVNLPSPWTVAGTGDFNGDGVTDILWRNTTTGDMVVSFMTPGGGTPSISQSKYFITLGSP